MPNLAGAKRRYRSEPTTSSMAAATTSGDCVPSISLTLTNEGFVYRPPYWRRPITVPWDAVLDVSTYEVSTGYSKQSFAQVKYVATTPTGPHEHRMLFNRLGNLKAAVDPLEQRLVYRFNGREERHFRRS